MRKEPFGRPTKYEENMPEIAYKVFLKGGSQIEVMAKLCIAKDTYYAWKKKYPNFSYAIKVGLPQAKAWFHKNGRKNVDNKAYNNIMHEMLYRRQFGFTEDPNLYIPELSETDDVVEQSQIIIRAIASGDISPSQGERLLNALDKVNKIKEHSELTIKVAELESRLNTQGN